MITIKPSILSQTIQNFNERLKLVQKYSSSFHIDIMDGKFVKNKSVSCKELRKIKFKKKFEFHLMIKNPGKVLEEYIQLKPDTIIFHYESSKNTQGIIKMIKKENIKVGIALNPETKVEHVFPYLPFIDCVLIMTVHPGFYGRRFIPSSLKKIKKLRKKDSGIPIEVDGSINPKTTQQVVKAGATVLVVGSYLFKHDFKDALQTLHSLIKNK